MTLTVTAQARADVAIHALSRAQEVAGIRAGLRDGVIGRSELSALVELPAGAVPAGVERIGERFGVVRGSLSELDALSTAHPELRVTWSPPLHPLLDRVAVWTGAPVFRNETGLSGRGAVVGIVDTGADITHPDLQNADGSSRIEYFIDYSRGPAGLESDAESHCSTKVPCAVYGRKDIDALLAKGTTKTIPGDTGGHGTHVASLAAGNGGKEGRYVGIAPDARLVIARALDASNQISDATVLSATSLIFDLAESLGLPAIVNVSLGSNFGPHDGSSALERGLADLVGDAHPGRAIVVAAGNSAGLFEGDVGYPTPLGVHTDVSVPTGTNVSVPVIVPPPGAGTDSVTGSIFVWAAFRPGDDIAIAVDRRSGELAPSQHMGEGGTFGMEGELTATVVVGATSELGIGVPDENAGAIIIEGTWPKDEKFSLRFSGKGSVSLWADAAGDISPDGGGVGALFPASTKESTVTIPAGHPDLIAVGATLNRTTWTDRVGVDITVDTFGSVKNPPLDSIAFFSSAGPTSNARMKPDLLAPGGFVVGAMSRDADPKTSPFSIFAESGECAPSSDCAVVDSGHGVSLGTSMAAPIVTGALALLFEQNPKLTSREALTLLQAGARRPHGPITYPAQVGAGVLDLRGTLDVQDATTTKVVREPSPSQSFLSLGAMYAHPDPSWTVPVLLKVRDASGHVADGFDAKKLAVDVTPGRVVGGVTRAAPGLYRLAVAADSGTGGTELAVVAKYDGRVLAAETLPIGVDVSTARQGFAARGGCNAARNTRVTPLGASALAAVIAWRGRRRRSAARRARNRGRTDT